MGIITPIGAAVGGVAGCEAGIAIGRCVERDAVVAAEGGTRDICSDAPCTKIGAASGAVVGGLYGLSGGMILDSAVTHRDKESSER